MSTHFRPLRASLLVAAALALAFAGWACSSSSSGSPAGGGTCTGTTTSAEAGACLDPSSVPNPPPLPQCDPCKDVFTECPLPPTQMGPDDGSGSTVYYYSNPACVAGVCSYCITATYMEDPCATGVCH